ncbi:MAG: hypothetical protein RMI91_00730 [Gemmatales bacterium]|nr:hypothetical protein [Gemmatales bacterium]MDW7993157.1 hypothetical protein [Gemmatales bacterium]
MTAKVGPIEVPCVEYLDVFRIFQVRPVQYKPRAKMLSIRLASNEAILLTMTAQVQNLPDKVFSIWQFVEINLLVT